MRKNGLDLVVASLGGVVRRIRHRGSGLVINSGKSCEWKAKAGVSRYDSFSWRNCQMMDQRDSQTWTQARCEVGLELRTGAHNVPSLTSVARLSEASLRFAICDLPFHLGNVASIP